MMKSSLLAAAALLGASMRGAAAFTHTPASRAVFHTHRPVVLQSKINNKIPAHVNFGRHGQPQRQESSTALQMGYNLPPGGGGGGGPGSDIKALLPGILTIAGITLFFISPLGGIFFAVTNTLFALAIITPFVGYLGLQVWQAFNTVSGPCPNCGAPVRVLKEDRGQPSLCINCGSLVRSNIDKDGIELCNSPTDVMGGNSLFDQLFGGVSGVTPQQMVDEIDYDIASGQKKGPTKSKATKAKRESTIIDVDVESD